MYASKSNGSRGARRDRGEWDQKHPLRAPREPLLDDAEVAGEGWGVDVGAADDRGDALAGEDLAQRAAEGGGGGGAGRFDGELGGTEEEAHGGAERPVIHLHQAVHVAAAEREAVRRGVRRAQAVRDGPDRVDRLRLAAREAAVHRV